LQRKIVSSVAIFVQFHVLELLFWSNNKGALTALLIPRVLPTLRRIVTRDCFRKLRIFGTSVALSNTTFVLDQEII